MLVRSAFICSLRQSSRRFFERAVWAVLTLFAIVASLVPVHEARADFTVPALTGPVVDEAGVLSPSAEQALEAGLRALYEQGGSQINVLTVKSLEGLTVEQASIKVVDEWKLGGRKTDNGALLLVAPNDRKIRIEAGQGLEGTLTDIESKRIIEDSIIPLFRAGDLESGVLVGVYQITKRTDPNFDMAPYLEGKVRGNPRAASRGPSFGTIIFMIFLFLILSGLFGGGGRGGRRFRRGGGLYYGGWGGGGGGGSWGGGGGGGSWGGGGGGFSGGGASGNW